MHGMHLPYIMTCFVTSGVRFHGAQSVCCFTIQVQVLYMIADDSMSALVATQLQKENRFTTVTN